MDYDQTLNLPKTDFPMRGNLPKQEPEILQQWETLDIYGQIRKANAGNPQFILHDGPPYANGHIHVGTALNKVLKDMVVKFWSQQGYDCPYIPGWDTHGLPIEQQAIKDIGLNRKETDVLVFRQHCRNYALQYVDIQREEFKRLGVRGDWDHPYLTLAPEFEAEQIGVFGEMAKKGFIYKGLKPVYWCPDCETALAEAEIDYQDKHSFSIYVKFPLKNARGLFAEKDAYFVIWTTTPWTLPANQGIAVHPEFRYHLVQVGLEKYLIAADLVSPVMEQIGTSDYTVLQSFEGTELEHILCAHPFYPQDSLVVLGEHVTLDQGTGCVHIAPGHGHEDFIVGQNYQLDVISPVNSQGRFSEESGPYAGLFYEKANKVIVADLANTGFMLHQKELNHQYPYCWRCKKPIILRATEQWFASIAEFRQEILEQIDQVHWIPAWGRDRIYNMVRDRGDWCISRQRTWGVPIPIFYCLQCETFLINEETIGYLQGIYRKEGSDAWFRREAEELLPPNYTCAHCGHGKFRKETDTMDVWFDSGSSHQEVLEQRPELSWPADLYLEGSDQHRGWFNSSLTTAVAVRGLAPYRAVLTHGYVVDEKGRKMSKSLGNVIHPLAVIEEMGADILRLWVSSADYKNDIAVSPGILKQMTEAYRKIRNTCRFILGNLYDYIPEKHQVSLEQVSELDRWALLKLHKLIQRVTQAYTYYEFHQVYHSIHYFCTVDMSAFYLDILKDRLYTLEPNALARRSAQSVLYEIIEVLVRLLSPVLTFTTEEIWRYLPADPQRPTSVQLAKWPQINEAYLDENLERRWTRLFEIREVVSKALELARQVKTIGHSLGAAVTLYPDRQLYGFLLSWLPDLADIFIVSQVDLLKPDAPIPFGAYAAKEPQSGLHVWVEAAKGEKCARCWKYSVQVAESEKGSLLCPRCAQVLREIAS